MLVQLKMAKSTEQILVLQKQMSGCAPSTSVNLRNPITIEREAKIKQATVLYTAEKTSNCSVNLSWYNSRLWSGKQLRTAPQRSQEYAVPHTIKKFILRTNTTKTMNWEHGLAIEWRTTNWRNLVSWSDVKPRATKAMPHVSAIWKATRLVFDHCCCIAALNLNDVNISCSRLTVAECSAQTSQKQKNQTHRSCRAEKFENVCLWSYRPN